MNLQGDEPAIDIQDIVKLNDKMLKNPSNIGTLAATIKDNKNLRNENIVKVITENTLGEDNFPKSKSTESVIGFFDTRNCEVSAVG